MRIRVESTVNGTKVSAEIDVPDIEATGEELEWLVRTFKKLVEDGILKG